MGLPAVVSQESPGRLGPYELVEQLGQGGMAIVYRARGPGATRDLVLKAMLPNLVHSRPLVAMFEEEARLTGELSHANIVRVEDYGVAAGIPYLTMEYLDGRNLSQIRVALNKLKRRVPIGVAVAIGRGLCRGLGYAHEFVNGRGQRVQIIHRDVSPSNVMVQRDGGVKLLDFGVAKMSTSAGQAVTSSLKGKFAYMAPEQVNQEPIDRRCDVFAAGIVLHELLTGKRLFGAKSERETLRRVSLADAAPPSALNPEVPPELDALILRALRRAADDRFDSGNEMAMAIEQLGLAAAPDELAAFVADLFPANDAEAAGTDGDTEVSGRAFIANVALDGRTERERGVSAPHLVLLPNDDAIVDEMPEDGHSVTGREVHLDAEPPGTYSLAAVPTLTAPIEDIQPTSIYSAPAPARAGTRAKDFDAAPTKVLESSPSLSVHSLPMVMVDMSDTAPERAHPVLEDEAPRASQRGVLENLFDADIVFASTTPESSVPLVSSVRATRTEMLDLSAPPVFIERTPRSIWLAVLGGTLGVALVLGITMSLHDAPPTRPAPATIATGRGELSAPRTPEPSLPVTIMPRRDDARHSVVPIEDLQPASAPKATKPTAKPAALAAKLPSDHAPAHKQVATSPNDTMLPPVNALPPAEEPTTKLHVRPSRTRATVKDGGIVDPFDAAE